MGCGESTGKDDSNTTIAFKDVGCKTIDEFFKQAKELVDDLTSFESSLQDEKDAFYKETGFEFAPGAKPKHAFVGMWLQLAATVNGDVDALKADFKADPPFAFVDVSNLDGPTQNIWKSFEDYAKAVQDIAEKLPNCLEKAEKLVDEAGGIQDKAESEFDALDAFAKVKAIAMTGKNVTAISKLPNAVKKSLKTTKEELEMLKEASEEVKNNMAKLPDQAKECAAEKITNGVPCYKKIHGDIPCTPEERQEWEEKMTAVMKKR
eukprot:NODE_2618_length_892_cov_68.788849_g2154_i0.p1 GENE.NODE_2618_length_892_cov_68.788849_g2154_i0~~NODE_2618_length_892_cov_68.788849_g2154_i0.p1  ORF type:complete len:263 (+),score=42.41 NODE_2618_length_892_cov_68.788849_g2154_i0:54-842(+)